MPQTGAEKYAKDTLVDYYPPEFSNISRTFPRQRDGSGVQRPIIITTTN